MSVKKRQLKFVKQLRDDFSYYFITSEIRIWYKYINQLSFSLFKRTENGACFYIAEIIISFNVDGTVEHVVELANKNWLNTKGDIYGKFELIVKHLNKLYK